jgi:hypothetical protein
MKIILQILALIVLVIGAMFLLAAAKMFTPKHAGVSTSATSTAQTTTTTNEISITATSTSATSTADLISISYPQANDAVASPLKVNGQARGNWYFEASFPVTVVDWDGKIIGQGNARANPPAGKDWMTSDFVPFEGTINFTKPKCAVGVDYCKHGAIIFKKDNPSDMRQFDASVEIPVVFQ